MSIELPKMGMLLWVEIAPAGPHDRLTVEDDGRIVVTDTGTKVPSGRGGEEFLTEEITFESVAEAIGNVLADHSPGALWNVVAVRPGLMAE